MNEYAEEVKDTTGLVYIGWFDNTKNITDYSIPECTKLYYRSYGSGVGVSLYRSATADEKQAEQEKTEQENKIKEERDSKIRKLKRTGRTYIYLEKKFCKRLHVK